jgi:hypothetical protein
MQHVVLHLGARFFYASTTLAGELAISDDQEFLLLVLIRPVDHVVISILFENLVVKALLNF